MRKATQKQKLYKIYKYKFGASKKKQKKVFLYVMKF